MDTPAEFDTPITVAPRPNDGNPKSETERFGDATVFGHHPAGGIDGMYKVRWLDGYVERVDASRVSLRDA